MKAITFQFKQVARFAKAVRKEVKSLDDNHGNVAIPFRCDEIIHSNHSLALTLTYIAIAAGDLYGNENIYVDDEFFKLPEKVQIFIYEHERGHIESGHLKAANAESMQERMKNFKKGIVSQIELEADAYAASVIGKDHAVAALFYLESHLRKQLGKSPATEEMRRRAEHLLQS